MIQRFNAGADQAKLRVREGKQGAGCGERSDSVDERRSSRRIGKGRVGDDEGDSSPCRDDGRRRASMTSQDTKEREREPARVDRWKREREGDGFIDFTFETTHHPRGGAGRNQKRERGRARRDQINYPGASRVT
jgi:hypothetical protein